MSALLKAEPMLLQIINQKRAGFWLEWGHYLKENLLLCTFYIIFFLAYYKIRNYIFSHPKYFFWRIQAGSSTFFSLVENVVSTLPKAFWATYVIHHRRFEGNLGHTANVCIIGGSGKRMGKNCSRKRWISWLCEYVFWGQPTVQVRKGVKVLFKGGHGLVWKWMGPNLTVKVSTLC